MIKIYTEKVTLPVFILHTKSINDEDSEKMKNRLSIILKEDYINYYYMDVIAREIRGKKFKFPSEGLPELEEKTKNEILTKGKKSAYFGRIQKLLKKLLLDTLLSQFITEERKNFMKKQAINKRNM